MSAIVCAGRWGRMSMDDAWCTGHLVERLDDLEIVPVWRDGALVGSRGGEDA
ncbi:hypothetical protein [Candidatus Palauibacter sp.]|uniref:hypothetical protein n=1 Tax=Candidatus Palauibacter sp. TaxID=3101350 RepID=UPI003B59551A